MTRRETGHRGRHALVLGVACASLLAIDAGGCAGPSPPPSASVEPSEVRCDLCGKAVARGDAQARVNLDGADVYDCKPCLAKARRRTPSAPG